MEWYRSISHLRLIPPTAESFDVPGPYGARVSDAKVQVDDVPPPPPPARGQDSCLQLLVVLADNRAGKPEW